MNIAIYLFIKKKKKVKAEGFPLWYSGNEAD